MAHATGSSVLTRPVAYRLAPNDTAAAAPKSAARRSLVLLPEPDESRLAAASTIPTAMTTSAAPVPGASCSPAATAMSAAIAPSVETIGATTPTLPILTPV